MSLWVARKQYEQFAHLRMLGNQAAAVGMQEWLRIIKENTMLQDKAMLANLTVRAWSARKRDRSVNEEVEKSHGAKDAGNYNKLLIDKAALKDVVSLTGRLRDAHYEMTLPWGDNGDRLLPASMYFEYTGKMRGLRDEFDTAVKSFVAGYPAYKSAAVKRLGTLYDAGDYPDPSRMASKFEARTSFMPVPDENDFRVELNSDEAERVRKDMAVEIEKRQNDAINSLRTRLRDTVERIAARLSEDEPTFRDSLIENARFACTMASKLNITGDEKLDSVVKRIESTVVHVEPEALRQSANARKHIAKAAKDVLELLPLGE